MKTTTLKEHKIEGHPVLRLISKVSSYKKWDKILRESVTHYRPPVFYVQVKGAGRGWTHISMTPSEERAEELWQSSIEMLDRVGVAKLGSLLPQDHEY